jgi:hypothetical protein
MRALDGNERRIAPVARARKEDRGHTAGGDFDEQLIAAAFAEGLLVSRQGRSPRVGVHGKAVCFGLWKSPRVSRRAPGLNEAPPR